MVEQELHNLIQQIQSRGCEEQTTEGKAARGGCPEKLYDTISQSVEKVQLMLGFFV